MDKEIFFIATFSSTHKAMVSEHVFEKTNKARLIPIPTEVSAGCGMALRADNYEIFIDNNIEFHKIYKITKNLFEKEVEEIVLN